MIPFASILSKSILFAGFTLEQTELALQKADATLTSYKKGAFLHSYGQPLQKFGLVLSGAIQVCTDDLDGVRMIMANVLPGETFGESLCFLRIAESPVYIFATEKADVLWLSPASLFTPSPDALQVEMQKRFTTMLAQRTLAMNSRIQVMSKIRIREKLMAFFTVQAHAAGSNTFSVSLSREDLATYIGTNRSALSRELSNMKKEGILDYYKDTFRIIPKK